MRRLTVAALMEALEAADDGLAYLGGGPGSVTIDGRWDEIALQAALDRAQSDEPVVLGADEVLVAGQNGPPSPSEVVSVLGPLAVLDSVIGRATTLRPGAVMLPVDLLPGATALRGWPVLRCGDHPGLVYLPPGPP